jgi:hypothetical protein
MMQFEGKKIPMGAEQPSPAVMLDIINENLCTLIHLQSLQLLVASGGSKRDIDFLYAQIEAERK